MKFYQHWIGDYQGATKTLSLMEHGAYRLLMDEYYSTEKPLPASAMQLHRICMAFAPEEQAALQSVLNRYFTLTEEGWVHQRIEVEIKKAAEVSEKRRLAAEKRWGKDASAYASGYANTHAKGIQKACYPQAQPQENIGGVVDITKEVTRFKKLHLDTCGLNTLPPLRIIEDILKSGKPVSIIDDVYQLCGGDIPKYRQKNIVERLTAIRDGKELSPRRAAAKEAVEPSLTGCEDPSLDEAYRRAVYEQG